VYPVSFEPSSRRNSLGPSPLYTARVTRSQAALRASGLDSRFTSDRASGSRESHRRAGARDRLPTCPSLRRFSLQFFVLLFLPVKEQNPSEALRCGGGRTTNSVVGFRQHLKMRSFQVGGQDSGTRGESILPPEENALRPAPVTVDRHPALRAALKRRPKPGSTAK
jgi:hypothetical protein